MKRHVWASLTLLCSVAAAAEPTTARVALVIGVNRAVDVELKPLRYADDDAAQYAELFGALGATVAVMARFDEASARLYPQVAHDAVAPVDAELSAVVERVAAALAQAKAAGARTELFVVYAGHGNIRDGEGALSLEDVRLPTRALDERIFSKLPADRTHFIVDACSSSFLAFARGAGGERAPAADFSDAHRLAKVGLILSTASARESHEWSGFQAGVFSHEIRSGLAGAADANHDGAITYRELAAFVDAANATIVNERYRPDAYVRPPDGGDVVLSLGPALAKRRLTVAAPFQGHHVLEDERGVRLVDFHLARGTSVSLVRPPGRTYLHLASDDEREWVVPEAPDVVDASTLRARSAHVATRGAAADAFAATFERPFTTETVAAWVGPTLTAPAEPSLARPVRLASLVASGALTVLGGVLVGVEVSQRSRVTAATSQAEAAAVNQRLQPIHQAWVGAFIGSGVMLLSAALTWFLFERGSATP